MVCLLSNIVTPNIGPKNIDKGFLYELLAATCRVGYYPATSRDFTAPFKGIFMSAVPNSRGKTVLTAQLTAEL
jgi:hypothetical protein